MLMSLILIYISDNASLKTEFEKSFMNTSIQEGQTATFQCKVRSTVTPAIKVKWADVIHWFKLMDH